MNNWIKILQFNVIYVKHEFKNYVSYMLIKIIYKFIIHWNRYIEFTKLYRRNYISTTVALNMFSLEYFLNIYSGLYYCVLLGDCAAYNDIGLYYADNLYNAKLGTRHDF